jgi:hypothetical protein
MLRHIISVSLAIITYAALIPTKVNAATIVLTPPGSIISTTEVEPSVPNEPTTEPQPTNPNSFPDDIIDTPPPPQPSPLEPYNPGEGVIVPEPLTIFGTAIGLGCGVLFKRKSSKKTLS